MFFNLCTRFGQWAVQLSRYTDWLRLDGPEIESRWDEIFRTCPDRPWDPPSLLYNGYQVFPEGKGRPERDADPSPPPIAVGHERVELYLYSPYGPYGLYSASVPVQGLRLLLLGVGRWSRPRPGRLTSWKEPVPMVQKVGLAPVPVLKLAEKSRPHRDSIPKQSSPQQVAVPTELSQPT